jgi:ACS family tartrate transporter-like MFS transporter
MTAIEDALIRKVSRRIIPFMIVLYLVSFLDRVNVGFAALTMNRDLGFTPSVFGWGAGIFFFGYFLFEVPSNIILEKIGARIWICRIMLTWGIVSAAMALVQGAASFYVLRFLLGVAEAGFLPGMILYLTHWFPAPQRARYIALFMAAVPLASVVGAPVSGWILGIDGMLGLHGWQWLFILEGIPACILGVLVLALLPDGPAKAKFLTPEERDLIADLLARDRAEKPYDRHHTRLLPALLDRRVLLLSLVYFGIVIGLYGIGLWLPQIVKAMGFSNEQVGLIVALPYLASAAAMILWGRRSDRRNERIWHVALPCLVSAAGFLASVVLASSTLQLLALGVAAIGIYAALGPFWATPSLFLGSTAAAGGIALINSLGNLGGFFGPTIVGMTRDATGSFTAGIAVLAGWLLVAAVAAVVLGWLMRPAGGPSPALGREREGPIA